MANTAFTIDKSLNVTASGSLGTAQSYIGDNLLANCISKSIEAFQLIDKEYKKAIGNDGKIIGTERTDLLNRVDMLLDIVIITWRNLVGGLAAKESHIRIDNPEFDFWFQIHEANGIWKANGHFTPNMNKPVKNFIEIYSNRLAPEVIKLLQTYKAACEDNVIDDAERESLKKGIKQVIYYILFLRFQLEKCFIEC